MSPPVRPQRDPLLDAADALEAGRLTHEQIQALSSPGAKAEAHQQDLDLGPWAAGGLGAARGASFGLSDLAQKVALSPSDVAATQATTAEHPAATMAGTMAGAAVPFLATGPESLLPGMGLRTTQATLGAAEGAGLTPGNATNRAVGAALGAGTAFAAPYLGRAAGAVGSRLPLVGSLIRGVMPAAATDASTVVPAASAEGPAVAPFQGASAERMGQIRDFLARRNAQLDAEQAARTPSAVAPTVPSDAVPPTPTPSAPVPPASVAPAGAATPALRAGESAAPIPNTGGRGIAVTGARATPPVPQVPTISEIQARLAGMGKGSTLPFYTRGGAAEQALPPGPVSSMPPSPPAIVAASQPLAEALQPGRFSGVARAMQSPSYQNAEVLAHRLIRSGDQTFKGMSLGDATAALRKMILAKVQAGGEIPALTSLPRFLTQLAP